MYAKKAMVTMFTRDVEVYQLPDGLYTMSKTQVGQVLAKSDKSFRQFLEGNSPEAAPFKGLNLRQVQIEEGSIVFHSVPFDMVIAYFSYWARQGNEIAMSIMQNCSLEYMNRVADNAFGVEKEEDDYRSEFEEREPQMEMMAQVVNTLVAMQEQMTTMNQRLEEASINNREYLQLKSNGEKHPGCLGVLEHDAEEAVANYITAREYLADKGLSGYSLANTFSRRSAQAMRVGKNICKLPMHRNQVIYSPEDVGYLDETLKSMMGL